MDRGGKDWLESVGALEVEAEDFVLERQQPLLLQVAGDVGGGGADRALEFGLRRCGNIKGSSDLAVREVWAPLMLRESGGRTRGKLDTLAVIGPALRSPLRSATQSAPAGSVTLNVGQQEQ